MMKYPWAVEGCPLIKWVIAARDVIIWHAYEPQGQGIRCWPNDWRVYETVLGMKHSFPRHEVCVNLCEQFAYERTIGLPSATKIALIRKHIDVLHMWMPEIKAEKAKIIEVVETHYSIGDGNRTRDDDFRLYAVVPGLVDGMELETTELKAKKSGCVCFGDRVVDTSVGQHV